MARLMYLKPITMETGLFEQTTLQDFYDKLECDCFDIAHLKIGSKYFDLFVDDEGLLKTDQVPSAVDKDGNVLLVGNIVFANHDSEGETTSLSDEDIAIIKKNLANVLVTANGVKECTFIRVVVASY